MNKTQMLKVFYQWNKWWIGENIHIPSHRRSLFYNLKKELSSDKITALIGPRQTGKSTLVLQLIESLIKEGADPRSILYLPLDDIVTIFGKDKISLSDIVEVFSLEIQKLPLSAGKKIIIFDEVHYFNDWSYQLKSLFDKKLPVKFIILGSSSTDILKGASESLAGRVNINYVLPMSFGEAVSFKLAEKYGAVNIKKTQKNIYDSFNEGMEKKDPKILHESLLSAEKELLPVYEHIKLILDNYLTTGGFPEVVFNGLYKDDAFRRLRQYIDLIFYKDFVSFFSVRDTRSLERLFYLICKETSNPISENKAARDLGISINTLRNYLAFLENAFLIFSSKSYATSPAKQLRRPEKLYVSDLGLAGSLISYGDDDTGKKTETAVFNHLKFLQLSEFKKENIFYWRKGEKLEVDLILAASNILPIEVKSGHIDKLAGLRKFMEEKKCWGLAVADKLDFKDNIVCIPHYLFLIMGG